MNEVAKRSRHAHALYRRARGWISSSFAAANLAAGALSSAAALLYVVASGCDRTEADLVIANASLREPAAGRTVASGYFDIDNRTSHTFRLVGARSELAEHIEMHTHVRDGDMLRMREVDTVDVPPDSKVAFAPGGLHLMLFGVGAMATDEVDVVLVFDGGREERVRFAVRRNDGGSP